MNLWAEVVWEQILGTAKEDSRYCELLQKLQEAEIFYRRIREKLSEEEQEQLETYVGLGEELDYRLAQLAWEFGCECKKESQK